EPEHGEDLESMPGGIDPVRPGGGEHEVSAEPPVQAQLGAVLGASVARASAAVARGRAGDLAHGGSKAGHGTARGSAALRGEAGVSVGLGESLRPERKSDSTTEEGPGQEPRRAGAIVREAGRAFQTDGTDRQRQDGVRASGDEAMRELQSATERETLAQSPAV